VVRKRTTLDAQRATIVFERGTMITIKRALISVSDKAGIVDFCRQLSEFGVEIISTGGTARLLLDNGITVKDIAEYTGFSEMLDGRVKTLHPAVHAGLLAVRTNKEHMRILHDYHIGLIDMVVVNLYPFEQTVKKSGVSLHEAIENIDIGGPSMLRSAAKNHASVAVICNPARYSDVIGAMREHAGALPERLLKDLAVDVFSLTSRYDAAIHAYLSGQYRQGADSYVLADRIGLDLEKAQDLRYGENPHQKAALYREKGSNKGLIDFKQLHGKELSFNNFLDMNAAYETVKEFSSPSAVIVKHNNPCGVAQGTALDKAFADAWKCDSLSAFGGIVALNRVVDERTARVLEKSGFLECIIAPDFSDAARGILMKKKNVRLVACSHLEPIADLDIKKISGGFLVQEKDVGIVNKSTLKVVTRRKPTAAQMESLLFAWKVAKHVKSNAIVIARALHTAGIGAGQMSRVDSVAIAVRKSGLRARGAVLASDAFFPKVDSIAKAAKAGIRAIIQPGGSISDGEIIAACNKYKIAMVFTGIRHFKH
jgi:phosphoribosylaminoimidazolecarboxamide formyltransferase / IMP cyclohydrolase